MKGTLEYFDVPLFHQMVDEKNPKLIAIFEVFSYNRDEPEFIENLEIFLQI